MNSNLFHNIANVVMALLAAVTAFMVATGCATLPTGGLECSQSWIDPGVTSIAITGIAFVKMAVNIVRDGLAGLFKRQPPVE